MAGASTFRKTRRSPGPGFFAAEAAGLAWLRSPDGPPVPAVLSVGESHIELGRVDPGRPTVAAAREFGRRLARLHGRGAPAFGSPPPGAPATGWIGDLPMQYASHVDFPSFWALARLLPTARAAELAGGITGSQLRAVERFCVDLVAGQVDTGPACAPARLHGDLWSGNVLWASDGQVWLVDPAAHGGHPDSDLAMLALFGAPHLAEIAAAYCEAAPVHRGWRERLDLHQLWPLLVHAALFGPSYGARAMAAMGRARG